MISASSKTLRASEIPTIGSVSLLILLAKLINSSFPDYESVIPQTNDQIMLVDCKSFSESIDRVSTISNEKFRTVKFDISSNLCVVSSFGNEKSQGVEKVKVEYGGPNFSINFNSRYVLDVLNIIKEGNVKFYFSVAIFLRISSAHFIFFSSF